MDPKRAAAEWFRTTVFRDETIRSGSVRSTERAPAILHAARSLANNSFHSWQSAESLFLKQGKLLAGYEDDYAGDCGEVQRYYTTYQSLTDRQLRAYFSWRTKLRHGDVREAPLSFAFLYIYELLNQIGVADPMDGYSKLESFRDAYGKLDSHILSYLSVWLTDYVVYYGLDRTLLSEAPQVVRDQSIAVLEHIGEQGEGEVIHAVKQLSKWLERSKFYASHREDMDTVTVRVLRRISAHYAVRCKKTMTEQFFGTLYSVPANLFTAAVFCDPLKRKNYEYTADEQCIYSCKNGRWTVWRRVSAPGCRGKLDDLLKSIDSAMRAAYEYGHPVKAKVETKWILRTIQEEVQGLLVEKKAAGEKKITIDYGQLIKIRQDAAVTQEKLIVDEEMDIPGEPAPQEQEQLSLLAPLQAGPAPAAPPSQGSDTPLNSPEYRLLHCLLYGGDVGWVQAEGQLLSVLVDSINEKLYDTFLDCVLDDTPQLIEDYIDDLKEMVHP